MNIAILQSGDQTDADRVASLLLQAGHVCTITASAQDFLDRHATVGFDLLIVDSPVTGAELATMLSAAKAHQPLPVMLLIGGSLVESILAALATGVDDYLIKPVRRAELLMRVGVLLARAWPEKRAASQWQVGEFVFDHAADRLAVHGRPVSLTRKEFDLALLFFRNLGKPLSRATLREAIWPREAAAPSRTVDTHVSRVRSKLGLHPENGFRLAPVYGYGYLLERLQD
jgi:DNA-binding response OmpR family regulator